MQTERIRCRIENDIEPIQQGKLLWNSSEFPWSGFLLEAHAIRESGRLLRFSVFNHLVALCASGRATACIRAGTTDHRFELAPGTASIFTSGCELSSITWSGAHEVMLVEVGNSFSWRGLAPESDGMELNLAPRFGIRDRQMAVLMHCMKSEIENGCPMGHLYGESLSLALRAYLMGRYALARRDTEDVKPKLSLTQFRRVQDYINAHLSDNLSVSTLAGLVGLSPHYFSCLFKNTVGITPHRYVLNKRISEGRRLLTTRQSSILEVAMTLGFASQSHFTDVFRKVTGTTPRRFMQEH